MIVRADVVSHRQGERLPIRAAGDHPTGRIRIGRDGLHSRVRDASIRMEVATLDRGKPDGDPSGGRLRARL
jgi:hypothetical protein